eukprot:364369-Chlamydomonas_euryale.AAC.11
MGRAAGKGATSSGHPHIALHGAALHGAAPSGHTTSRVLSELKVTASMFMWRFWQHRSCCKRAGSWRGNGGWREMAGTARMAAGGDVREQREWWLVRNGGNGGMASGGEWREW